AHRKLFEMIDLKKAWDDPANAKAARTLVEEFVTPSGAPLRDRQGFAVTHFALVRGSLANEQGLFPLDQPKGRHSFDVSDGLSLTVAIGQVHADLGPWIAAGPATARRVAHPTVANEPTFGSQFPGRAYFGTGKGNTYFLDMARTNPQTLQFLAECND